MSDDECGVEQGNGKLCDNPVKYADGKCGIHTTETDTRQGGAKFTDERARLAIEAARDGKSIAGCERAAGVGKGTIGDGGGWLDQNLTYKTENGLVANFSGAFAQARGKGEDVWIAEGCGEYGDASFAKFMLASSHGYKKTEQRELTGEGGGSIIINTRADDGDD
jgi:hypothetical protein